MVFFDALGFSPNYGVDADPEFPADGNWRMPIIEVASGGSVSGGPQAIIQPPSSESWVLSVHFNDVGSICATPDPDVLCVVDRFTRATLVKAANETAQTDLAVRPVVVAGAPESGLLLIADEQQVSAFGPEGRRWTSVPIFEDDLRIRRTDNGRIVCRGVKLTTRSFGQTEVTLDAGTGEVIR